MSPTETIYLDQDQKQVTDEEGARFVVVRETDEDGRLVTESFGVVTAKEGKTKALKIGLEEERDQAERRLEKRINGAFQAHLDAVLKAIREGMEPDLTALNADLRSILEFELTEIAAGQADWDTMRVGVAFDPAVINLNALEWAQKYAGAELDLIDHTTREFVQKAVATFIATPGVTNEQLIELLKTGGFSQKRAELIAITEVTNAMAQGTAVAQRLLKEEGIDMVRVWHTSHDPKVCPIICQPLNGLPETKWPEKYKDGPAAHGRCRCWVGLTLKED